MVNINFRKPQHYFVEMLKIQLKNLTKDLIE